MTDETPPAENPELVQGNDPKWLKEEIARFKAEKAEAEQREKDQKESGDTKKLQEELTALKDSFTAKERESILSQLAELGIKTEKYKEYDLERLKDIQETAEALSPKFIELNKDKSGEKEKEKVKTFLDPYTGEWQ